MQRIKDTYLQSVQSVISLTGKIIAEIGCGTGTRTREIAHIAQSVIAIDPKEESIQEARQTSAQQKITYLVGSGEQLPIESESVDIVFFTLSFHHIPFSCMPRSIQEAVRIVKSDGFILFFEPGFTGSFFEAECRFDACDGDERLEKAVAYSTVLSSPILEEVTELTDETIFSFDSVNDFIETMHPQKNQDDIEAFLQAHAFQLRAERRLSIYRPNKPVTHRHSPIQP